VLPNELGAGARPVPAFGDDRVLCERYIERRNDLAFPRRELLGAV
jgi:hypothetical protein